MSSTAAKCLMSGSMPSSSSSSKSKGVLCKVCGDEASGFHYGVDSCEGCKGFFRRCLTQGMNHKCAVNERCDITPFSRNSCQFCRLKKCFQVGMSREASRLGRRPKRLKEMNQTTPETVHHHRHDKKNFTGLNNLFPFPIPLPHVALNMADLQTFMRNLNSPMGVIASHQNTILPPPPPPPPLLSSFYHLENVNMSFFPNSNLTFSNPHSFSNISDIGNLVHGKSGMIGKPETPENAALSEDNISLSIPDLLKASSLLGTNCVGQSFSFSSPSVRCYVNSHIPSSSPAFLSEFEANKVERIVSSPQVFSPIIVSGGGGASKRFKPNFSGFFPKSFDMPSPQESKQEERFAQPNIHPSQKLSSSFSVDFLKCSSNLDENKDSPVEGVNPLFVSSNFNVQHLKTPGFLNPSLRRSDSPSLDVEGAAQEFGSKFPANRLRSDWRECLLANNNHKILATSLPYSEEKSFSCDHTNESVDQNAMESEKCSCCSRHKCGMKSSQVNNSGTLFLRRRPHNHATSSSEPTGPIDVTKTNVIPNGEDNVVPVILRIENSDLEFVNHHSFSNLGESNNSNHNETISSTELDSPNSSEKLPLELPSSEDGGNKNSLTNDETDSVINVNDRDQYGDTSFCDLEFQPGRENRISQELLGAGNLQENPANVAVLNEKNLKINEGDWMALSAELKKQIFLARNTEVSRDRNDLINLVESSLVNAHLQTCIYTSAKVKEGIKRYEEVNMRRCDGFPELHMNDPMKWWEQFVNNMVPVIKRIVMFSKKLPGFSELNQEDQIVLIKQGSFEVILTRYTLLFSEGGMFLPDMSVLVPRDMFSHMPLGDFFEEQCKFANDFNKLKLDDYETGIFSGIMIMNPEREGLENIRAVQKLQVLYMQALYTYMKRNRPDDYDEHFIQTICSLPKLLRINDLHSKKMQGMRMLCANGIKMPDLHKEMFHY